MNNQKPWYQKKLTLVILLGASVVALSQIGNGLKAGSRVVNAVDVAYAAKETADKVDTEFKQYLAVQQASTQAIQSYIAQQQSQAPAEEVSDDEAVHLMQWTDEQGTVRKMCCQRTDCWTWHKQTQCKRE